MLYLVRIYIYCDENKYYLYYNSTSVVRVLYNKLVPRTRYTVHNSTSSMREVGQYDKYMSYCPIYIYSKYGHLLI